MQNDLISRKRVVETIWDVFNSYANDSQRFDEYETEAIDNAFTVLQKCVENQPTAYDVEKVVAELSEEESKSIVKHREAFELHNEEFWRGRLMGLEKAIEIVRNGGKE